ncbi:MAG: hypothetical protein ACFFD4_04430 [Candidatus Odinarchaeota archaeon]
MTVSGDLVTENQHVTGSGETSLIRRFRGYFNACCIYGIPVQMNLQYNCLRTLKEGSCTS